MSDQETGEKRGRWLSNHHAAAESPSAPYWQTIKAWADSKVVGPPKATDPYTVAQLVDMGMVGLYEPAGEIKP